MFVLHSCAWGLIGGLQHPIARTTDKFKQEEICLGHNDDKNIILGYGYII